MSVRALILAVGNRLRRDDGVAHQVLSRLAPSAGVQTRALFQLSPEIAQEIADYDVIVFVDADVSAAAVTLELAPPAEPPPLTHVSRPADIIALSAALFGFVGDAYLCRIPVDDLSAGEGLSPRTAIFCGDAVRRIEELTSQILKTGQGDSRTIG